jgi:hypothetical protein
MRAGIRADRNHGLDSKATIEGLHSANQNTRTKNRASRPHKDFAMREQMRTQTQEKIRLGDLIVAIFDEAANYSSDPNEVSRLAALAVMHMLRTTRRIGAPLPPSIGLNKTRRSGKQAFAGAW